MEVEKEEKERPTSKSDNDMFRSSVPMLLLLSC